MLAHEGTGLAGGFVAGFQHPLSGPDHMLAMIAVGFWAAFLGRPMIYLLPMTFPFMMAVGGALTIAGVPLPLLKSGLLCPRRVGRGLVPACSNRL